MKMICALLSILTIAGCASNHSAPRAPDGYYNNETKWQENQRHKQELCVLRIIEIAPPTATPEELDYNLNICMMQNDLFILNDPHPEWIIGREYSIDRPRAMLI